MRALRADEAEGVIYLGSFSKTFAPGFRVGWALAPHMVREKLVLAQESATLCPPQFSQMAVSAYLSNHDWQGQIKQFREMYRERRDAMVEALDDLMPAACQWNVPDGGFYVWLTLPPGIDAKAMLPRAVTARVAYVPGTAFFADGFGSGRDAAVLLLPDPGADPRGRTPPRGRDRGRDGAARDVRRQRARPRGRLPELRRPELRPELSAPARLPACSTSPTRRSSSRARPASASSDRRSTSSGADHVPREGGVLLACNHIGYVDFVYGGLAANPSGRKVRFMAKRELFDHRLTGPLMRSLHHIEVDRGEGLASFNTAVDFLRQGEAVGIFPEATISRALELKEFKTGAVRIAAEAGVPLVPVVMWGTQRMMTKDHPRDFSRGKTILLRVGDPLHPTGEDPVAETAELHRVMSAMLDEAIADYPAAEQPPGFVVAAEALRRQRPDPRGGGRHGRRGEGAASRETAQSPYDCARRSSLVDMYGFRVAAK